MTISRYKPLTISLHWLTLLLIIAVYCTMEFRGQFERGSEARDLIKAIHYVLGVAILLVTFVRIAVRVGQPYPAILPQPPAWQHKMAAFVHGLIYLFLFTMPILGWLLLSAEGKHITIYSLQLPALMGPDEQWAGLLEEWHETLAVAGYWLLGAHALAALYHHYVVRDNTLRRMSRS